LPFSIAEYLINLVTEWGYLSIFITMTLESTLIPIPSEIVMPFAGYLVFINKLNFIWAGLIASIANLAGSIIAYFIGVYGGRPLVLKYGKYVLISEQHIISTEKFFSKHGEKAILIGRCLPGVRTVISLPAGFGKMDFKKFILFTFIGSLPWNYALTLVGYLLGENWKYVLDITHYIDYVIIAVLIGLIVYFIIWYVRKRKNNRA
jgi:membrane protein DedA with SNARE-associated domain